MTGRTEINYPRQIRAGLKLTQKEFAGRIGISVDTIRNWEQGKRRLRGAEQALLKLIEVAPGVVFFVLRNTAIKE